MNRITDFHSISAGNNKVFVNPERSFLKNNSFVEFTGENNILFIEDGAVFSHTNILFSGSNAVVYISQAKRQYVLDLTAYNNTAVYIGENNIIWDRLSLIASEGHNIVIGKDSLISWGVYIRTADPHLIYDLKSHGRINPSKSVFLGDHIWIGQRVTILKGTCIGSGSIVGANSVAANKLIPSNVSAAGNPAKIIREDVFFSKENVNAFTKETSAKYAVMDSDDYIYSKTEDTIDIPAFDEMLQNAKNAQERFDIVMKYLVGDRVKNRFFIPGEFAEKTENKIARMQDNIESIWKHLKECEEYISELSQRKAEQEEENSKLAAELNKAQKETAEHKKNGDLLKAQLTETQDRLKSAELSLEEIRESFSYRLGLKLTALPRKIGIIEK